MRARPAPPPCRRSKRKKGIDSRRCRSGWTGRAGARTTRTRTEEAVDSTAMDGKTAATADTAAVVISSPGVAVTTTVVPPVSEELSLQSARHAGARVSIRQAGECRRAAGSLADIALAVGGAGRGFTFASPRIGRVGHVGHAKSWLSEWVLTARTCCRGRCACGRACRWLSSARGAGLGGGAPKPRAVSGA